MDDGEKVAELEHDVALCAARQGDLDSAALGYGRALSHYERVQDELGAADCHLGLGTIALRQDRLRDAERNTRTALASYRAAERWTRGSFCRTQPGPGPSRPGRTGALVNAWATAGHVLAAAGPHRAGELAARTVAMATDNVLDAAQAQNRPDLVAEIIESSRVTGIVPARC
jgi:hypothetical protein